MSLSITSLSSRSAVLLPEINEQDCTKMTIDLAITETTLPDFLERTAKAQATDIQALTVTVDYDRLVSPNQTCQHENSTSIHDSLTAQTLWTYLRDLARALQHMTALKTFAFIIVRPKCTFWLPRDILTDFVQNLPLQCHNLEIDTENLDRVREPVGLDDHFCKAINRALPNLQHLRLRLYAVCPLLFQAASAPMLETVSMNCIGSNSLNSTAQTCRVLPETPLDPAVAVTVDSQNAAPHIAQSLRAFAAIHCPRIKLATVTDVTHCDWNDRSTHFCYSIRDAVANETYALPFVRILWGADCNILLRARDGEEWMSDRTTTPLLAEGQVWKETTDGLRLPAAMFLAAKSPYVAKPLHTLTVAEWRERNPTKSCSLWANEKKTGRRLLDATVFEGLGEHAPLKEDTPEGFVRHEEKSDLWPVDR